VCPRTAYKWLARFKAEGAAGLADRSSRPRRLRRPTSLDCVNEIIALRRQRLCGNHIAKRVGVSPATVSRILRRAGLSRMRDLDPIEPARRYERANPGEMIHLDIKKRGRIDGVGHRITGNRTGQSNRRARGEGVGWEFAHVAIDDASRIAFVQMKPDEKAVSAVAFLKAAVAYYESLGVTVSRVMTDNGSCYKAFDFRDACRKLSLRRVRTRPYTPKTNGKAERFARPYTHSDRRNEHLPIWLHQYNWHRPHGGIQAMTPISRLALSLDNLLTLHI
jgi:transposase InsO family protein